MRMNAQNDFRMILNTIGQLYLDVRGLQIHSLNENYNASDILQRRYNESSLRSIFLLETQVNAFFEKKSIRESLQECSFDDKKAHLKKAVLYDDHDLVKTILNSMRGTAVNAVFDDAVSLSAVCLKVNSFAQLKSFHSLFDASNLSGYTIVNLAIRGFVAKTALSSKRNITTISIKEGVLNREFNALTCSSENLHQNIVPNEAQNILNDIQSNILQKRFDASFRKMEEMEIFLVNRK